MFLHVFGTPTLTLPIVFNELRFQQLNVMYSIRLSGYRYAITMLCSSNLSATVIKLNNDVMFINCKQVPHV